jgi:membrane-associated phospholipid phosphatase
MPWFCLAPARSLQPIVRPCPTFLRHTIDVSSNISNAAIYGTGTAAGSIWIAGLISDNPHQKETGLLTLEALTDAMPIYTVLQVIAGRERPGEGTGNGRFWQKHWIDGSFPAGHAMFCWTMATVVAHEYPRWWRKIAAAEQAVILRLKQLENSADHHHELIALRRAGSIENPRRNNLG